MDKLALYIELQIEACVKKPCKLQVSWFPTAHTTFVSDGIGHVLRANQKEAFASQHEIPKISLS